MLPFCMQVMDVCTTTITDGSTTETFYLEDLRTIKVLASLKFRVKTPRNLLLLREHERQLRNTIVLVAAMLNLKKLKRLVRSIPNRGLVARK